MHLSIADRLLEVTQEALLTVDRDGRISYANTAVIALFNYRPSELTGLPLEHLLPGGPKIDVHGAAGCNGNVWVARRRDGSEFRAEVLMQLLDNGTTFQAIVAVRDRTEREFLLQQAVDARLDAERLQTDNDSMLLNLVHDFRQPLQALQLLADLLRRKSGEAQFVSEAANHLHLTLQRLHSLIDERLLVATQVDAGTHMAASAEAEAAAQMLLEPRYSPERVSAG